MERRRWFLRAAVLGAFLPPLANLTGWIFTEMGRQPWLVYGLLKTNESRSPLVGSATIVMSLVGYTVLYGAMLLVGGRLFLKEIAHGPEAAPTEDEQPPADGRRGPDLVLAY
jgi:cytochrome d ubiquinol oxidase subunit I